MSRKSSASLKHFERLQIDDHDCPYDAPRRRKSAALNHGKPVIQRTWNFANLRGVGNIDRIESIKL